tara:strand:+ start:96599 stop:97834 length:1236 start_codon:yes stop_codon:yes gene_type:complete
MPTYNYTVITPKGKTQSSSLKADTATQAQTHLSKRKLIVTHLELAPFTPELPKLQWPRLSRNKITPLSPQALLQFTQDLATLISGGLSLDQSLETLSTQEKTPNTRALIADLCTSIHSGQRFSQALAKHPKTFPALYRTLIESAELGSALDIVLKQLAEFLENTQRTQKKIQAALIYPSIVMSIALLIVGLLVVFVVPKFQTIFADVLGGAPLPWLTQLILDFSQNITSLLLPLAGGLIVLGFSLRYIPFIKLKPTTDRLALQLPLLKDLITQSNTARFSRTLCVLLTHGVPLLEALKMSTHTVSNHCFTIAYTTTHQKVLGGLPFSKALAQHASIPPAAIRMIQVGEETGQLAPMLGKLATTYEETLERTLSKALTLLEPTIIILLAITVGTLVIALFLPLIGIIEGLAL